MPVVAFTSRFDAGLREELLATEVLDYVAKDSPESLDYLLWMVRRLHLNQAIAALVVDDSRITRQHVAGLLARHNFRTVEAASAEVALGHLQARDDIALVITDHMPGMSGFDFVKEVRRTRSRYRTAIIGLSSSGGAALSAKFIKWLGGEEFAVLLPDADAAQAGELLEQLRERFAATTFETPGPVRATLSIGAVGAIHDGLERALGRADAALYQAKHRGRNRLVLAERASAA